MFISSADWMPRNLDRRVELLVPVEDPHCRKRLVAILETCFEDNVKARRLLPDGSYQQVEPAGAQESRARQEVFYRRACEAAKTAKKAVGTVFEPERPVASQS